MSLGLNASAIPDLFQDKDGNDLPIESLTNTDKTAYLKIDLQVNPMGGAPVTPMTAVFAPDPTKLSGNVDLILWLHGDKSYWNNSGTESENFSGKSIQYYLTKLTLCKLREFILQSSKKRFVLVAPTLNDRTGISGKHHEPAGLRWEQADAEAYLQQVVNGVRKHMGANVSGVGNIVLAAHSGGGHVQGQMAQYFSGMFDKMNEVWCFDSMYWGSEPFISWTRKGHSNAKLWVYSTGGTTAANAAQILKLTKPKPPERLKYARAKKDDLGTLKESGIWIVNAVLDDFVAKMTKIEVLILSDPDTKKQSSTDGFLAAYGGIGGGHYEGMQQYLAKLVETSQNLK